MANVGEYNTLKVVKEVDFGLYLDGGDIEILLPTRFVPAGAKPGDELEVFIYHDSDNRLIATTQKPLAVLGEIALLKAVAITAQGAFLDWGLMKDIFVPKSQQTGRMFEDQYYLVAIYMDDKTGRVAATERIQTCLSNDHLTIEVNQPVDLIVWQKTDIGYKVIVNSKHIGVLHFADAYKELEYGERLKGFVKNIRPDNKLDVVPGERGYQKVSTEKDKILSLLKAEGGYLPYNDKTAPETIYEIFGMSKKTFKMTIGSLYKEQLIELTQAGIKLVGEGD